MISIINPNSYIIVATFVFVVAFIGVWMCLRRRIAAWIGLGVLVAVLIAVNLLLRVGVSEIETTAQFEQILTSNKPVVLEIYSNY